MMYTGWGMGPGGGGAYLVVYLSVGFGVCTQLSRRGLQQVSEVSKVGLSVEAAGPRGRS